MPTDLPYALQRANSVRAFVALERRIRTALDAQSPPEAEHRRALAALLLAGLPDAEVPA